MANLYTGTHSFTGYKTLTELTGLTFTANTTYSIQVLNMCQVREGEIGKGYLVDTITPFDWKYDGENDLYIGDIVGKSVTINISK
jgi:hypothetical protein